MEDKPGFAFVGDNRMASWILNVYFPQWECLDYGAPGEGLAYVKSFHEDASDCQVMIQFGNNDIYQLSEESTDDYIERHAKTVLAVPKIKTYLFCIFPHNDCGDYNTAVNKFIRMLNEKTVVKLTGAGVTYLSAFGQLLKNDRLNPGLTIDDLRLNGKGCQILNTALKQTSNGQEHL